MIVSCSGIDGSGKTELARRLASELAKLGLDAECVRPRYVCNEIVKRFCATRFGDPNLHVTKMRPGTYIAALLLDWLDLLHESLEAHCGRVLVCDRYVFDVMAQAIHYGADVEPVLDFLRFFPSPDVSFFLDVTPTVAHARLVARSDPPVHVLESLDHLETLAGAYHQVRARLAWRPIVLGAEIDLEGAVRTVLAALTLCRARSARLRQGE